MELDSCGPKPIFRTGTHVRVRTISPRGHCRTPFYLRGCDGVVEQVIGRYRNPEQLAYHKPGLPRQYLYRVIFKASELWPGCPYMDEVAADLYEHWLEDKEEH